MRSNTTQQNIWAQLGVSACALLLPPTALGAAVFSMLPARNDGRPAPSSAAEAHAATPRSRIEAAWPVNGTSQSVTEATELAAAVDIPAIVADGRNLASPGNAGREPASKKEAARALGPVPVRVTIVTPPAAANAPPPAEVDGITTGSVATMPWPSAASELSTALLPRILPAPAQVLPPHAFVRATPASQVPTSEVPLSQAPASAAPATQAPAADRPSAEGPAASASTTRKRVRQTYLRTLAHSGARAEARTVRRNAQPQPEQTFSFKDWLEKLGTGTRNPRG